MQYIKNILQFISQLAENNNREWFSDNKKWYEEVKTQFEEVSKNLILAISAFDEEIKHVEAKDCIFRIYRDTRFSHDKTPYKTHFGVFIASAGGRKSQRGGYYLHLDPAGCFVGSGVWCPDTNLLKKLRQSVFENIDEFNEIRNSTEFSKYFKNFYEEGKLKKIPTGFPKDFQDAELLKLKHYLVEHTLENSIIEAEDFLSQITTIFKASYPLNRFLNYTVDETV